MSIFRGFTTYDYGREYFVFFIKISFEISQQWFIIRNELEKKLQEEKKKPQDTFEMETEFGDFLCQFEKSTKCYFILLSNSKTIKEEQKKLLQAIIIEIKKNHNYDKLTREEFQKSLKQEIQNIISNAEQEYIQKYGNLDPIITKEFQQYKKYRKDLAKEIEINEQQKLITIGLIEKMIIKQKSNLKIAQQNLLFKGFMMLDYVRQYFFMMVNKMISVQKKWIDDRNAIYKQIMDHQHKHLDIIKLKGENGQFYAKYHKEKKCYFILYSGESVNIEQQQEVINKIYLLITQVEYIKMTKEEIELKFLSQVKTILDQSEKIHTDQVIMKIEGKNNNSEQKQFNGGEQNNAGLKNLSKNNLVKQEESYPLIL
ncbi:unnamed protein product [Paramecium sonneborni]|uniref:Uncharacterized protein n=1 Tax=Paramecium sonneborni TaxID=65129 RepID=A0A8S1R2Q7_9CILI|nr:unnamed protein product [Paramecium sonneborni]